MLTTLPDTVCSLSLLVTKRGCITQDNGPMITTEAMVAELPKDEPAYGSLYISLVSVAMVSVSGGVVRQPVPTANLKISFQKARHRLAATGAFFAWFLRSSASSRVVSWSVGLWPNASRSRLA